MSVKFLREKYLAVSWGEFHEFIELNLKLSYVFLIPKKRFIKVNVKRPTIFIINCSLQHELAMKWKGHLSEGYPGLPQTSKIENFSTIING